MKTTFLTAIAVAAIASTAAIAQDYSLNPTYGTHSLNAGFLPDPAELPITAGGSLDASSVGCAGAIANAPDARLMWGGGSMTIGANSNADTTLVINAPDGQWYCSDDVNGLNPALSFSAAGQYDVWVGVYAGSTAPATLYVTEY
ncbi:peptidase S1 [Oceanicaulis sp.]|uniref:peptidase S1 n=1 Tax=Oceanicaulis sp. TaxID=1924941 RepID=UPI003BA842A0